VIGAADQGYICYYQRPSAMAPARLAALLSLAGQ